MYNENEIPEEQIIQAEEILPSAEGLTNSDSSRDDKEIELQWEAVFKGSVNDYSSFIPAY